MSEIKIINAKKIYNDVPVIENLNVTIPKGSLFTLLGPNEILGWFSKTMRFSHI